MAETPHRTPFEQIQLGDSDMTVSSVGFGTYHLRDKIGGSEAIDAMGAAFESGITLFDTSDNYGTEELIGLAVREGILPRDEVVIATKTGLATSVAEARLFGTRQKHVDLSPGRIEDQVEKSLRLLGDDVGIIDLYQLHSYDPDVPADEIVDTMDFLIQHNEIRAYGVSNYPAEAIEELIQACDRQGVMRPITSQVYANIIEGYDSLPTAEGQNGGMTTIVHSPLHRGMLTHESVLGLAYDLAAAKKAGDPEERVGVGLAVGYLAELQDMALRSGHTLAQLAVAYALHRPETVVLSSPTSEVRLADMHAAAAWEPDQDTLEIISEAQRHFAGTEFAGMARTYMESLKPYYGKINV